MGDTLRTGLVTRGISRRQFLGAKVCCRCFLLGGAGFIIIVALSVLVGSLDLRFAGISGDGAGIADSGQWSTAVVMFGESGLCAGRPTSSLALFLSVLTSSSSMGIAFSLAYVVVEIILLQFLSDLFEWFGTLTWLTSCLDPTLRAG